MARIDVANKTEFIIDQYTSKGLTTVEIASLIGCSDSSVGRLLARHNIPRFHTPNEIKLSSRQRQEVCERYLSGETSIELSKTYEVCDNTIRKILRDNNIDIRPAKRRSKVAIHNYFHSIDSADKAYFLGWMISDGSIVRQRPGRAPVISIELKSTDKYIIEDFAEHLGATKDCVHDSMERGHSYFRFASQEMANDLAQYGVIERKTGINHFPVLTADMMPMLSEDTLTGMVL